MTETQRDTMLPINQQYRKRGYHGYAATAHQAADRLQQLQQVVNRLPSAIIVLDDGGKIIESNPAAEDMLGVRLDGCKWVDIIEQIFSPKVDDGHEISLRNGRRVSLATQSLSPCPGQLLLISDHTETRRLQENLQRQKHLQTMGEMLAQLAHQIRTPLATAMLYINHIISPELMVEKRKVFAEKIKINIQSIEQQVKDMLLYAKGHQLTRQTIVVDDVLSKLEESMVASLKEHETEFKLINKCQRLTFNANGESLVGALQNLVNNALQARDKKKHTVALSAQHRNGAIEFVVKDNGRGMTDEMKDKVLQAFFTTRSSGTGLGLAVVQAVAEAHDGNTWIKSELGIATEVGLRIPLRR